MKKLNILNIYQTLYKLYARNKTPTNTKIIFKEVPCNKYKYHTNHAQNNFSVQKQQLKLSKFCISIRVIRGPTLLLKLLVFLSGCWPLTFPTSTYRLFKVFPDFIKNYPFSRWKLCRGIRK